MKKRMPRMDQMTLLLFNVFAVFMTIVCLYPMYNIWVLSILSPTEAYKGGLRLFPNSVNFAAYRQMLDSKEILNASVNPVLRVVIGTTIRSRGLVDERTCIEKKSCAAIPTWTSKSSSWKA